MVQATVRPDVAMLCRSCMIPRAISESSPEVGSSRKITAAAMVHGVNWRMDFKPIYAPGILHSSLVQGGVISNVQ